jgi:S1-C subfamily serine protease
MFAIVCSIWSRARYIWAGTVLLLLVSTVLRVSHAYAQPEPIAAMVARVSPAVVRVITVRPPAPEANNSESKVSNDASANRTSTATGSGYIIDPSGYIGTNKHVVDGAISVFVVTNDGIRYPANILLVAGFQLYQVGRARALSRMPWVTTSTRSVS